MGKLIATTQATIDGVVDPVGDWVQPDGDHAHYSFERQASSSGLVLGRKTYEGLAAVWPQLTEDPVLGRFAGRINAMPKYVASRTLTEPLEWNATLIKGELETAVAELKNAHSGRLIVSGAGELAHTLARQGLADEFWFRVHPTLWATGARVFDGVGPIRLDLVAATPYRSGVVWLRYRPATG